MMAGILMVSRMLAGVLRMLAGEALLGRVLAGKPGEGMAGKQPGKPVLTVALPAGGALLLSGLLAATSVPDFFRVVLEGAWMAVCAHWLWGSEIRIGLFVGVFYEIAVFLWQFLLAAGLGIAFRSPAFLDSGTREGQAAVWLIHAGLSVLAVWLGKRRETEERAAFQVVSGISVAGLLAVVTLSEQSVLTIADDTLYMWTILAVVLMMAMLVFRINRQYEMERELAKLKSERAEWLERDYRALNQAYEANAKLFHDFHNHIGVLRQFLSRERYGEAVQYLDELQAPVRDMLDTVWTGDGTADYLINSKAAAAAARGIRFRAEVEFPRHTNIRSADLCAILGNLLDNALEAAGQAPEGEDRYVSLTIRRIHQMLVIKVENSFSRAPVRENGEWKTTKGDGGLHGWGLKSAQAAAEAYDGMVQAGMAGDVFRAVATLSYQGVREE